MFFKRPRSLMERIFTGPTNADILDEIPEPITRHIYEMPIGGLATLPGAAYLRQVPSSLFRVSNLTLLAKRHVQFHRLLEGPEGIFNVTRQKELHDVYLVGAPERWSRLLRGQVHSAWSLYCEGHFYSLAKGSKGALIVKEFQCSDPDDVNQRALSPLIAYHLGKTDYAPAQIHRIARWVVTNMCQLSFSSKNDGHFVSALTLRIICTPRLSTVLLGSRSQIWARDQWIASAGSQLPIPSGFYTGYMIVGPNENAHGGCARQGRIFEVETAARCLAGCWTKGLLGQISQSLPKALATVALTMGEAHVNYGPPNTTRGYLEALGGPHGIKTLDTRLEKMDLLSYLDWEGSRWAIILGLREMAPLPESVELAHCFGTLYYFQIHGAGAQKGPYYMRMILEGDDSYEVGFNRGFDDQMLPLLRKGVGQEREAWNGKASPADQQPFHYWDSLIPGHFRALKPPKRCQYQILVDKSLSFPSVPRPYESVHTGNNHLIPHGSKHGF